MLHATDISLHGGGYFDWADIGANSHMRITDVANGLASTARYAGQLDGVYNVAQHSVLVCTLLEEMYPGNRAMHYAGLMHDATESLMGDATSPMKRLMPDYQRIEAELHGHMAKWFGFHPTQWAAEIRCADLMALAIEKRVILHNHDSWKCLEDAMIEEEVSYLKRAPQAYLSRRWGFKESRDIFMSHYEKFYHAGIPDGSLQVSFNHKESA